METGNAESANGAFTAGARAFDFDIDLAEALIKGALASGFASELGDEGSALFRTVITESASARPGNDIALNVGDGDDRVIEGAVDMRDATRKIAFDFFLAGGRRFLGILSHKYRFLLPLTSRHLLVGDGLSLTFAGTGIGFGALPADRKASLVTDAAIASDFL